MKIKLLILALLGAGFASAQNNTNSPYSSRGYGEIEPFVSVFSRSLGGATNGIRTNRTIAFGNPASVAGLTQVSFDFAFRGDYSEIYNSGARKNGYNGNFNYFSLGFPVFRKPVIKADTSKVNKQSIYKEYKTIWSSAIGMTPFSNVNSSYYKIQDTSYGQIGNYFLKSGGLNRVYFMNGVNITQNFSVGLNSSFIFGQIRSNEAFYIQDSGITRATFSDLNSQLTGFRFDLGFQGVRNGFITRTTTQKGTDSGLVRVKTSVPLRFVYGATFSNAGSLNYNVYHLVQNKSNYYAFGPIDTIVNESNIKGKSYLPSAFSAGFSFTFNNKWMIAADYSSELWASMKKSLLVSDSFANSSQVSIGLAYRPDINIDQMNLTRPGGQRRYNANLEYRLGLRMNNTGYLFKDNAGVVSPLKEYGVSFGIGIPKLRDDWDGKKVLVKSLLNITGEYIHRGTTDNGMIAQNLYRLTIGFTISDIWFKQKKFF